MSSHHIIRDNQEPAIWFVGDDFNDEIIHQLLGWSPIVIASESVAELLDTRGIKLDYILTNEISREKEQQWEHQFPITLEAGADDFQIMNVLLERLQQNALYLVGAKLNQLEDYLSRLDSQLSITIYSNKYKIIPLKKGFKQWFPAGTKIQFHGSIDALKFIEKKDDAFCFSKEGTISHTHFHPSNGLVFIQIVND